MYEQIMCYISWCVGVACGVYVFLLASLDVCDPDHPACLNEIWVGQDCHSGGLTTKDAVMER